MADNEYNIDITTSADASSVEELAAKLQEVESSANSAGDAIDSIDGSSLDDIDGSASSATTGLDGMGTAADTASAGLANVTDEMNNASSASDGLAGSVDGASESLSTMDAVAATVAGAGLSAMILGAISDADNFNNSWKRIQLVMGQTGQTIEQVEAQWSPAIKRMTGETGRGAGLARQFIIDMGIAGIESSQLIEQGFIAASGAAYVMGTDVASVSSKMQTLILTGNASGRMLKGLGLSIDDLGVSAEEFKNASPEMRAEIINTALASKYGTDANNAYKSSWGYVTDQLGLVFAYASRLFGDLLLPIAVPVVQALASGLKSVADWFANLNGPMKGVATVGAILITGLTILVTTLGALKTISDLLNISWALQKLGILGKAGAVTTDTVATSGNSIAMAGNTTATTANTTSRWAGISALLSSVGAWLAEKIAVVTSTISKYAHIAATYALAAATKIATAAQWALNVAMSMNPIAIIIILIIALVAVIIYLWSTNEGFREALINAWNTITEAFTAAGQAIYGALMWLWNKIVEWVTLYIQLPTMIWNYLIQIITRFVQFGADIKNKITSAFSNVVNTAKSYMSRLPGIVWNEMINIGNKIAGAAGYIFQQVQRVFGNIVQWAMQALGIASPGFISRAVSGEMESVVSGITGAQKGAYNAAQGLGDAILSGFGNPSLSVTGSTGYGSASMGFDAAGMKNSLSLSKDDSKPQIVQYINQEGIMSENEAAERIVQAVKNQLWKENLISGRSE